MVEGEEARRAVAESGRRTTSRRDLSRAEGFEQVSPEVGELDETAFDELLGADPDAALTLLADLTGATDEGLRELARRLAGRVMIDVARTGVARASGTGRLVPVQGGDGDVDLDRSLDAVVSARAARSAPRLDELTTTRWSRPAVSICLLVDRSGSMAGERLAAAAVAAAAVRLRHGPDCAVVAFSDEAVVLASQGEAREPEGVVGDLLRLRGHGPTDVGLALRTAATQLARSAAGRRLTVLLSDCRSTTGAPPHADARALDELVIVAPEGDLADAVDLADACGGRCLPVGGPSSVAETLILALSR